MTERNDARDPQRSPARAAPPEGATLAREASPGTREPDVLRDARDDARRMESEGAGRMGRPASDLDSGGEAAVMGQEPEAWLFEDEKKLAQFIGDRPKTVTIKIHIVGPLEKRRILSPCPPVGRERMDEIEWRAGANCGHWTVSFSPAHSPLSPAGDYSSGGPRGGMAAVQGIHKYTIRAFDTLTEQDLTLDPDVVIIPGL